MRAVALSDEHVIKFLNENYINTWVSNIELERTPSKKVLNTLRQQQGFKPFDKMHPLAQTIMKGWKKGSPADSIVISPKLELMGRLPVNETAPYSGAKGYLLFLKNALDGKMPGLNEDILQPTKTDWNMLLESGAIVDSGLKVVLTKGKPEQEVLSVFRTQDYTIVEIDVKGYKDGGMLNIEVWIGDAELAGSFHLFPSDKQPPMELSPENALTSVKNILPDERKTISHRFRHGQVFKLGAIGAYNEKSKINGFLANISVKPIPTNQSKK